MDMQSLHVLRITFHLLCCFILLVGYAESLVNRGGLYINLVRVGTTEEMVDRDIHLLVGNITLLRVGEYTAQPKPVRSLVVYS